MTTKRFVMTIKSWSGQVLKVVCYDDEKAMKKVCYDEEIVFLNSVFRFFGKCLA